MRRITRHPLAGTLAAALLVVGLAATAAFAAKGEKAEKAEKAGGKAAQSMTVSGTFIDTKCYAANHDNIGNDHGGMVGCGTTCAKGGIPVGLLVDGKKDGHVMILLAPSKAFADYIGKSGRVTGKTALGRDTLLPEKVEVKQDDGTYKSIDFSSMM